MPRFLGEMKDACLENLSSDPSATTTGRIYHNTTTDQVMVDNGTSKRALLRNDGKCLFGTSGTASNNVRLHRGSSGLLQFVTGNDTTAELTLSTSLAQVSARVENSTSGTKPAAGNAGRLLWLTDNASLMVDTGTGYQLVGAQLAVTAKTASYTATLSDGVILCDATSGALNVTLYSAVGNPGKTLSIKKVDVSLNAVSILPNGAETLDTLASLVLPYINTHVTLVSDGANWKVISSKLAHVAAVTNSASSASNSSSKAIPVNTVEFDPYGLLYNSGGVTGLKVKETGLYRITANAALTFATAETSTYAMNARINGGTATIMATLPLVSATKASVTGYALIYMSALDYVEVYFPSSTGPNYTIISSSRITLEKIS